MRKKVKAAVAEKWSAPRTEEYFRLRAEKGEVEKAKAILRKAGRGNPPRAGDEL